MKIQLSLSFLTVKKTTQKSKKIKNRVSYSIHNVFGYLYYQRCILMLEKDSEDYFEGFVDKEYYAEKCISAAIIAT